MYFEKICTSWMKTLLYPYPPVSSHLPKLEHVFVPSPSLEQAFLKVHLARRAGTDHQKPGNITVGPVSPACAKSSQLQAFCNEAIWVSQTTCQSTTCRCVTTCHLDCCTHNTPCGTRTRNLRIRSPTPCPLGQGGLLRCDKHH